MYLYKTILFKDLVDVYGAPETNDADKADFEVATKKDNALEVNDITIEETTFEILKSYEDFDAIIDGQAYSWNDVRYIDDGKRYTLYLTTSTPV